MQRDHVLGRKVTDEDDIFAAEEELLAREQAAEAASAEEQLMPFQALGSEARFDRVLYDGGEFGHAGEVHVGSEEEMDFLGIPGLLEPRPGPRPAAQPAVASGPHAAGGAGSAYARRGGGRGRAAQARVSTHERLACCAASSTGWSPRGTTAPASRTASPTRRCARSAAARRPSVATAEQLQARIDKIRDWAVGR